MSKKKEDKVETNKSGLKRRRVQVADKVIKKPLPVSMVKPKRKASESNPVSSGSLVFPTDKLGLTVELKAAMIKVASRIGHDEKNMQLVGETLEVLMSHVAARFKQNCENGTRVLKRRSDRIAEAMAAKEAEKAEKKETKKGKKEGK